MDVWDNDVIDEVEEAHITFGPGAHGEIAFYRRQRRHAAVAWGYDRDRRPPRWPNLHPQRRRTRLTSSTAC